MKNRRVLLTVDTLSDFNTHIHDLEHDARRKWKRVGGTSTTAQHRLLNYHRDLPHQTKNHTALGHCMVPISLKLSNMQPIRDARMLPASRGKITTTVLLRSSCRTSLKYQCALRLHRSCLVRSTGTTENASTSSTDERLKTTLADLDALLGIQEESQQEDRKVKRSAWASWCVCYCWSLHGGLFCRRPEAN